MNIMECLLSYILVGKYFLVLEVIIYKYNEKKKRKVNYIIFIK